MFSDLRKRLQGFVVNFPIFLPPEKQLSGHLPPLQRPPPTYGLHEHGEGARLTLSATSSRLKKGLFSRLSLFISGIHTVFNTGVFKKRHKSKTGCNPSQARRQLEPAHQSQQRV